MPMIMSLIYSRLSQNETFRDPDCIFIDAAQKNTKQKDVKCFMIQIQFLPLDTPLLYTFFRHKDEGFVLVSHL